MCRNRKKRFGRPEGGARSGRTGANVIRRGLFAAISALLLAPVLGVIAPQHAHATTPGLNGKIAFTSDLDGRTEVYTANIDGSGVTELTDSAAAADPSWSPDGSSISYAGGPDPAGIYTIAANGGTPHRVTDGSFMTAWSGDGARLAFVGSNNGSGPDIFTVNLDGTGRQDVAPGSVSPAWSPDGSRIAYRGFDGIYIANADGSNKTRLTTLTGDDNPSFSPDGTKIAFDSAGGGSQRQVWIMNVDGSNQVQLTLSSTTQASAPSWSPDGTSLVVRTFDGSNYALAVMKPDGTELHTVISNMGTVDEPDWQPIPKPKPPFDGRITFMSPRNDGFHLYTALPDGSDIRTLTSEFTRDITPSWSPDGSRVAFIRTTPDAQQSIDVMNADGTNAHTVIAESRLVPEPPEWSPDGSKLSYTIYPDLSASTDRDIWTVNADGAGATPLIAGPTWDSSLSWSPSGDKVVYADIAGIMIANPDGTNPVALTTAVTGGGDDGPRFSPDGTKIVWSRRAASGSDTQIWRMNADGTGQTQLTSQPGVNAGPRYSPDGKRLVLMQQPGGSSGTNTAVMNADGSGLYTLFTGEDAWYPDWQPMSQPLAPGAPSKVVTTGGDSWAKVSWTPPVYDGGVALTSYTVTASPGGARVSVPAAQTTATLSGLIDGTPYTFTVEAVNSAGAGAPSAPSSAVTPTAQFNGRIAFTRNIGGKDQIFTANADGTDVRQITNYPGGAAFPSWSPDGTQLAIDGGPDPAGVYIINVDGSNPRRIADPGFAPRWSPDGQKVAYFRGPATTGARATVEVVNVDGTGESVLGTGTSPAWTPDSQRIVFLDNFLLWVMNADGSGRMPIGAPTGAGVASVSPDGTQVVFAGSDGIRIVGIDGSGQSLVYASQNVDSPTWSPDGREIVFQTRPAGNSPFTISVMNADGTGVRQVTAGPSDDELPAWQPLSQDPNGTFVPLPPTRILDTRVTHTPVGPDSSIEVQATGKSGLPAAGISAVVVNLTATEPSEGSYLTAFPTGTAHPLASNLNFGPGQTIANLVVVKVGTGGEFSIYNARGFTHVIADVVGWYSDGSAVAGDRYTPLAPARILDTRATHSPVGPNQTIDVQATGEGLVPSGGVSAVVVNITATEATAGSYLTAFPTGTAPPVASNLNFGPGQTIANLVVVKLGTGGKFTIYNAQGFTQVIADVVGWYSDDPSAEGSRLTATSPARILDTRTTHTPIGPNASVDVQAAGTAPVPPGALAVVVNLTATDPTAGSYLTAFPAGTAKPLASNLNFGPGQTVPNSVVVKLGTGGKFSVYNAAGSTDVIADVVGWYS
jgi:Tol biopolymer transport system component